MVNIITGPRNSGKSTRFFQLWKEAGETGQGIFSQKRKDAEGNIDGYDLVLLPSLRTFPLAYLHHASPSTTEFNLLQGRFAFSQQAFENATKSILSRPPFTSVWIDEVGKLEFRGVGYAQLLRVLLEENADITLTIRDSYLPTFLAIYGVTDFRMI